MKKFLYILILIALVGISNPASQTNAAEEIGQCTVRLADKSIEFQGQTTYNACKAKARPGISAAIWERLTSAYQLLAPLPCPTPNSGACDDKGKLSTFNPAQDNNLGAYLNIMIKVFIGICAVLSVVMIVMGGLEYMTSELSHSKEAGKEKISQAIFGLLIALGAYVLLFTINPDLLRSDLKVPTVAIDQKIVRSKPGSCSVQSARFIPSGTQTGTWYNDTNKPDVIVDIKTIHCEDKTIEVSITEEDGVGGGDDDLSDSELDNRSITVPPSNHIIMHLKAGEEACETVATLGDDCNYYITISELDTPDYESNKGQAGGNLRYECDSACLDDWTVINIELPVS